MATPKDHLILSDVHEDAMSFSGALPYCLLLVPLFTACDGSEGEMSMRVASTRIAVGAHRSISVSDACVPEYRGTKTVPPLIVCQRNCACTDDRVLDATFVPTNSRMSVTGDDPARRQLVGTREGPVDVVISADFSDGTTRRRAVRMNVIEADRIVIQRHPNTCFLDDEDGVVTLGVVAGVPVCMGTQLGIDGELLGPPESLRLVGADDATPITVDVVSCALRDEAWSAFPAGSYSLADADGKQLVWEPLDDEPVDIRLQSFTVDEAEASPHACLHRQLEDESLFDVIDDFLP